LLSNDAGQPIKSADRIVRKVVLVVVRKPPIFKHNKENTNIFLFTYFLIISSNEKKKYIPTMFVSEY